MTFISKTPESNVCSFINSFSTRECFLLLELTFLLSLFSLVSKSVFIIRFACANLATNVSAVNSLNFGVVIYLS